MRIGCVFALSALCAALLLPGCANQYEDIETARSHGAIIGESVFIDGVDVSGLDVDSARAALERARVETAASLKYSVTAGNDAVFFTGAQLPIEYDYDAVLLEAVSMKRHYPAGNPPRTLETTPEIRLEPLRASLESLCAPLSLEPKNASWSYGAGSFIYVDETPGRHIDTAPIAEAVAALVRECRGGVVAAAEAPVDAEFTVDDARAQTTLISSFSTSFAGSTYGKPNRVHNIEKAAGLIDGVTLQPGALFDMNETLGDRNGENGWREAAGIRYGAYVQEYGGGVCQVSTTLYNAVLMADLDVEERTHHSWPLGYVDIGRDATISTDGPNFKFINSSSSPVTISTAVDKEEKTVTVSIYGVALEDGVTIALTSKKTGSIKNPGNEIKLDASLPVNTRVTERESRAGAIAETYKLYYDSDGTLIDKKLVTTDKYRAIKGLVLVSKDIYYGSEEASSSWLWSE